MVSHHGSLAAQRAETPPALHAEFEQLRKIELSYLTLFKKSSRFANTGFNHFFLSQELTADGFSNSTLHALHAVHPANDVFSETHSIANSNNTTDNNGTSSSLRRNKSSMTISTVKSTGALSSISVESHAIYNLSFSHDGKYLASGGADGLIRVWEVIASEMDRQDFHNHNKSNHNRHGHGHGHGPSRHRSCTRHRSHSDTLSSSGVAMVSQQHRKSFIETTLDDTINDITSFVNCNTTDGGYRSRSHSRARPALQPLLPPQQEFSYKPQMHSHLYPPQAGRSRRNTLNSYDGGSTPCSFSDDDDGDDDTDDDEGDHDDHDDAQIYAPVFKSKPVKIFYHDKTVNSLDWSKNNFLLSSSEDGTAKLWHVDRADCLQTYRFDSIVTCAQFHKLDDRFFVASQWNGRLVFISILEKEISFEMNLNKYITCLDFSPDCLRLFVGCDKGYMFSLLIKKDGFEVEDDYQLKKKKTGQRITGIKSFFDRSKPRNFVPDPRGGSAKSVSDDGGGADSIKLLLTSNDSKCRLINYSHKFLEVKYTGYTNKFSSICATLNEDHTFLITGSEDGWTYLWQIYSDKRKKIENEKKMLNKAHFDILNFFKDDTSIIENKYYGSFHTNNNRCNVSIFAPRASSKLLELSNDPIFDLKHQYSFALHEAGVKNLEVDDLTTAIIITGDNTGKIKIFRRDFARYIRKAMQTKKMAQLIERRREKAQQQMHQQIQDTLFSEVGGNNNNKNNSASTAHTLSTLMEGKALLNRNALVIPSYEATPMNIADTMKSVYLERQGSLSRGRPRAVEPAEVTPAADDSGYFSSFSPTPTGAVTPAVTAPEPEPEPEPVPAPEPAEIEQQLRVLLSSPAGLSGPSGPSGLSSSPSTSVAQRQHARDSTAL